MSKENMKRKIAAVLCMAMMSGLAVPSALAESTPSEATGVEMTPQYAKIQASAEVTGNAIVVRASGMSNPVICAVLDGVQTQNMNGTKCTFENVANGEHMVQVRYNAPDAVAFASDVITVTVDYTPAPAAEPAQEPAVVEPVQEPVMTPDADSVTQTVPSGEGDATGSTEPTDNGTTGDQVTPTTPSDQTDDSNGTTGDSITPTTPTDDNSNGTTDNNTGVEPITPSTPSGDSTGATGGTGTEAVKQFTISATANDKGAISVKIDGASNREIEVTLLDAEAKTELTRMPILGDGTVNLGYFPAGTYTVRAQYTTPVQGADGQYDYIKANDQTVSVTQGVANMPEAKPIDIQAKVEIGSNFVLVTVTDSADVQMYAALTDTAHAAGTDSNTIIKPIGGKGSSALFSELTPGKTYEIEVDYESPIQGASPYRGTISIPEEPKLDALKITGVTADVNMLTVTGTATAGQQVILTTTPAASAAVYAVAGSDGKFSAQISCAAGTYTAVTAKYVADDAKTTTVTGNWVVAAPAARPTLTVDTIDTTSTTVIAKTTPGIVVEIKTSDYSQKVVADEGGILRFSLPHTYAENTKFTFTVYYGDNLSFTQEAAVAKVPYLGTLEYGDEGDAVKKLTARLEALGYPVEETSRYGSTVREAVRLFQIANGLGSDGIAGVKTQQVLFSVSAIPYGTDRYPTLVRGDRGLSLIYTLQQRLKDLGYYTIKVDGIFGSGTQRAVRLFQQVNGLSVTGKADNTTQTLLYSSAAKPISGGVSGDYTTLSRSNRYKSAVVPMQRRLKSLGYYSGNIDGYFGSQTYRAVRNFQSRNGLSVTGVADPYTQEVLYSSYAKKASGSSGSSSSGYRLLYWGCRGDSVKRLQNALISAGYKSIVRKADGIYGQWTYDAVRAYQKDHGLSVDGIAGKNTQNALYGTHY